MTDGTSTPTPPAPSRKPWDPPFPTAAKQARKESSWLILPPSLPRKGHAPSQGTSEAPDDRTGSVEGGNEQLNAPRKQDWRSIMGVVWPTLAVLAGMLLVFLFALLIAHCLAWFVVYKTEARLGEARRGLVQGGDMRLCLCARG
ncbi:hypothetical protein BDU57DRAFT_535458 [Ampelomyces quisqualis]|uniref:Uncharacterized protein n=1 Tax=Ampelomyces quisqualis TaxID=50730 RepID=A0A6A5R1E0_AMPQU|nr:hypothetical protein BDU57DRAFT_535458 [Ampelomyces quisqualis]